MKRISFGILSTIIALSMWTSCQNGAASEQKTAAPPAAVTVYKVTTQGITGLDSYPATVVPLNEVELRAEVSGTITNIFVKDGETVTKGQKLYEIDRSKYQANYKQAQAQLKSAQANLAKVEKDVERYKALQAKDAIARQVVEHAETDLMNAQSQVLVAEAALANAQTDLGRSLIVAPFGGTIGISNVRLGGLVSVGSTLINTISSTDPIAVDVAVNEKDIYRFSQFMQNPPKAEDSIFTLQLPGGELYPSVGELVAMDRAVDPQTGTIKARLSFDNPNGGLRAGMSGNVKVRNQDNGDLLVIPYIAVSEQLGEFFVYVVDKDNVATQQRVILGTTAADKVVVRKGLKAGDVIVVSGLQSIRNGSTVAPEPIN